MAIYKMGRTASNNAQVCKDGVCYDNLDISSYDTTVRAFHWDGTTGRTELCDGTDYDTNTGEGSFSAESDIQVCIDAWQTAYDDEQQALADAQAEAQAEAEAETP